MCCFAMPVHNGGLGLVLAFTNPGGSGLCCAASEGEKPVSVLHEAADNFGISPCEMDSAPSDVSGIGRLPAVDGHDIKCAHGSEEDVCMPRCVTACRSDENNCRGSLSHTHGELHGMTCLVASTCHSGEVGALSVGAATSLVHPDRL